MKKNTAAAFLLFSDNLDIFFLDGMASGTYLLAIIDNKHRTPYKKIIVLPH